MKVLVDSRRSYLFKLIVDKILEEKQTVDEPSDDQSTQPSKPQSVNQVIAIDELPESFCTDYDTFQQLFTEESFDCLILDLQSINATKPLNNDTLSPSLKLANLLSFLQRLELDRPLHLIGLSSVLTWNAPQSKKSGKPLKEKQYKKRSCSAKYLQLKALEQSLLTHSSQLSTTIIARGLVYGQGECLLEPMFRSAWLLQPQRLPVIRPYNQSSQTSPNSTTTNIPVTTEDSNSQSNTESNSETNNENSQSITQPLPSNMIPMVHVQDHATFVFHELTQSLEQAGNEEETEPKYFIAVDQSIPQSALIQRIAEMLGNGVDAVEVINQSDLEEQANLPAANQPIDPVLIPDSELVDWLAVDLNFDPATKMKSLDQASNESEETSADDQSVAESTHASVYHSIKGFAANHSVVKQEFITQRNLKPVKIWVDGRPVTGKSRLAAHLATKFSVPHLSIGNLIEDAKNRNDALSEKIKQTVEQLMAEETERINQLKAQQSYKKLSKKELQKIEQAINQSVSQSTNPRLPAALLVDIVREKVNSPACRNAGFVLDGFPRTSEEAKLLFECEPVKQSVKPVEDDNKPSEEQPTEDSEPKAAESEDQPTESAEQPEEHEESEEPTEESHEDAEEKPVDEPTEEAEDEAEKARLANLPKRNPSFFPLTVISILSSGQTVSLKYSQTLSYDQLIVGHNDPEGITRRWQREVEQSNDPADEANQAAGRVVSPITYLSEIEPLMFSDDDLNNLEQVSQIIQFNINQRINESKPIFNYHPTPAELKKIADIEQSIKNEKEFEKRLINQRKIAAEQARISAKKEREQMITQSINRQEQERLEAASAPLRAYLIDNVLPAVVQGLTEVVTISQAKGQSNGQEIDPIEYLSEFLYRYALNAPMKRPALGHQNIQPIVEERPPSSPHQVKEVEESKEQISEQQELQEAS